MGSKTLPVNLYVTVSSTNNRTGNTQTFRSLVSYSRGHVGSENRAWKSIIKAGKDATTTYTAFDNRIVTSPSTCHGKYLFGGDNKWYDMSVTNEAYIPFFSQRDGADALAEASLSADTAFFKKLRDAQRAISGPTFLGELRQTKQMLKRPAAALRDYTIAHLERVRKLTSRMKGNSLKKALAKSYLEWQFGVKPLLNDTRAAADALARTLTQVRQTRISVVGKGRTGTTTKTNSTRDYFSFENSFSYIENARVTVKAGLRAQPDDDGQLEALNRLRQTLGFTFSEFIPTAWELLPWSFLLDYFGNIGSLLEAWTTDTSDVIWYSRSSRTDCDVTKVSRVVPYQTSLFRIPPGASGRWKTSKVTLARTRAVTYPSFTFRIPGVGQLSNMTALWVALRR